MTLYAILDQQGKMCSDVCNDEQSAWVSLRIKLNVPYWKVTHNFYEHLKQQGYRIAPVGCYNPETQVVIDKSVHEYIGEVVQCVRDAKGVLVWNDKVVDKFLSAGEVEK